ncbi:MAG: 4'-phosphopantetheinyl transferase superfamily protein [Prevotellaceae bacterium]|jgi:4'-phosphopantetheinyl transferase EntD|nr:4'-phosphopantetheinyl transferase superfamily protein [Prevotellaceae bacterium]
MKYKIKNINNAIIGIAPIDSDSEMLLSQLACKKLYLPYIEKMPEHRKREWLTVRLLIKELLGEEKEIAYQPNRKPYLSDGSYFISISHTNCRKMENRTGKNKSSIFGYVAVVLDKEKEVAIDIEKISPRALNVRERFINAEEAKAISPHNEMIHVLLHWSAKESVFKRMNLKDLDFKEYIHIQPFEPLEKEWNYFEAYETKTATQNPFHINYYVHEEYVLTVIL